MGHFDRLNFLKMRRAMYTMGESEICHNLKVYDTWSKYQQCATLRDMRMEYLIPKYPLHQVGFYVPYLVRFEEIYKDQLSPDYPDSAFKFP